VSVAHSAPTQAASPAFIAVHLAICAVTWGFSFVCMKLMNGEVDPFTMSFARALLAAGAMAAWVMALGQKPWPDRSEFRDWIVLGSVNGWIPNILVAFALERMAAGMASMVQAATPIYTAVIAHMLFADERLTRQKSAGIALGFSGMLLLLAPRLGQGGAEMLAILAMIGVVVSYGTGNIYTRYRRAQRPERLALGQQGFSAIVSAAIAFPLMGIGATVTAFQNHAVLLVVLGLVCTALPIAMFMRLITRAGPTKASMVSYAAPGTAVFMAVLILGETLSMSQLIGGAVIILGVALMTLAPPARVRQPA
jgi:drug/metabolite transporter (DMT)-like permease